MTSTTAFAALAAALSLVAPLGSSAAVRVKPPVKPRALTGQATHVLATSALLTGVVNPEGLQTSYYFQYGPTVAYGSQTPTVSVGAGTSKVKVGQLVSGLRPGTDYHFRIVAVTSTGIVVTGRDRAFAPKGSEPKVELSKPEPVLVGSTFILRGVMRGLGAANHQVVLQASPYPYLEAFTQIGPPAVTNAAGVFSFRVAHLSRNTQFRVLTLDSRPTISPTVTVLAAVAVTLHVRTSKSTGLARLYGTVSPAVPGARVVFQLHKAVRPGKSEATAKFIGQFATTVKKGGRTFSRFSLVVKVRHTGRYRAFVKLGTGPYASGYSATVVLHAAPGRKK
jgi:hypothetical protein